MFESLSERLERSFKILKGEGKITEINVAETVKDIRKALLDADVSYKVAKDFCNRVKDKAIGANVLTAVKPQQMMIKIMHDELADFMGSEAQDINVKGNPGVVLVAGLNGSGKTTFSGKLALHIKSKKGMKVLLAACDTFRPAAIEQLKVLGEGIQVPVYTEEGEKDPIKIAKAAIAKAKAEGYSVVIVDTAGRLAVDQQLMDEISALHEAIHPTETLFVVDAMTGQDGRPHQDGRRHPRRCGPVHQGRRRQAHQVRLLGREDGGAGRVPSFPHRGPYPRHGRRGFPRGKGPGAVR